MLIHLLAGQHFIETFNKDRIAGSLHYFVLWDIIYGKMVPLYVSMCWLSSLLRESGTVTGNNS